MKTDLAPIQLDKKAQALVDAFATCGDWLEAAVQSGYTKRDQKDIAKQASQSPAILAAVHVEIGRRLVAGAAIGYRVLIEVAKHEDDTTSGRKLRLEAAKELLKLGGHVGPRAKAADDGGSKQLHEMSLDDLKAHRDALSTMIADRAKGVNAPQVSVNDAQAIDLLD